MTKYHPVLKDICLNSAKVWRPPPDLNISEWADKYRRLSAEASAEPGQWRTSRAEYQRGMLDAVCNPLTEIVVIQSSTQIGKTEILNCIVGFHMHQDPAPILCLQPTLQMAQTWSKDRLAPMIRDTPVLTGLVNNARARDSGNTLLKKEYPGGQISMTGANSPASLASRPIRILLCDEIDKYPFSAGTEGDPVNLARKRTATFWNKKIILVSTPTIKGMSRIEAAYLASDQRKYFMPCPDCGTKQVLQWANLKWDEGKPQTAYYVCAHCGVIIQEHKKIKMLAAGEWRSTAEGDGKTAGFHINELYSPWRTWAEMAADFLEAKKFPETLKTFVNTSLGETWEEKGEGVDEHELASHMENYTADEIPNDILLITAAVDVQGGKKNPRLEMEVLGWGTEEETWSLDYIVLPGDPEQGQVWLDLDEQRDRVFVRSDGQELKIACCCVDSGGTGKATQAVYHYVLPRQKNHVFAIKGTVKRDAPIVGRPTWQGPTKQIKLYPIGTHSAKDQLYGRLKIEDPGPGYCHFPSWYPPSYFEQLTSERRIKKFRHGVAYYEWVLPAGKRNEPLDIRNYNVAAMHILQPKWRTLARRLNKTITGTVRPEPEKIDTTVEAEPVIRRRQRHSARKKHGGFVSAW